MSDRHKKIILAAYPEGMPRESDFRLEESPVPKPGENEFLARALYLSVDPFLRMLMNPSNAANATSRKEGPITDVGRVMAGGFVGEVVESNNPKYPRGAIVEGILGWQNYVVSDGWVNKRHNPAGVVVCDSTLDVPVSLFASVLGRAGLTPYFCMTRELRPQAGETAVITSAAGAGGSIAGQIAKMAGCHVVGICGSDEKVDWITRDLGFDVGINYKTTPDIGAALRAACPRGVDVHYDNVGGPIMEAIAALHTPGHRYRLVGIASAYNTVPDGQTFWAWPYEKPMFVVHDYTKEYDDGIREMAGWIKEGTLKYREDVVDGIENTAKAFIGVLNGDNIGKRIVRIAD
ncbi:MAG: NADP-dependent oxidoreductase [Proteobacteria bacterium]|nr:NADP-dependent oxidoreductase [Pseudomonadota bacterium]MDA1057728.1 NADP-dependent oxidoreductase [Pseudomonadota bacterium]